MTEQTTIVNTYMIHVCPEKENPKLFVKFKNLSSNQSRPEDVVKKQIEEFDIEPFKELLQKLIVSCTKDNIQVSKSRKKAVFKV